MSPRYLTKNSQNGWNGIRKAESHAVVAVTGLSYLSFRYFDGDITDDEVDGFITRGEYALHKYSQSNFLHHIRGAWHNAEDASETLKASTEVFLKTRWNPAFRHIGSEPPPSSSALGHMQSMDQGDYKKLSTIAAHLKACNLTGGTKGLFFPVSPSYRLLKYCVQTWAKSRYFWPISPVVLRNVSTSWHPDSAQERNMIPALHYIISTEQNCSIVPFVLATVTAPALRSVTSGRPMLQNIND